MSVFHVIFACAAVISALCIVAVVFLERRNPASSLAWILVLLFLPIIGFILYLFIGTGFKVTRKKRYALKAITDDVYDNYITKHLNPGRSRIFVKCHARAERLLTYLREDGEGLYTDNNAASVFTDGNVMFESLLKDIQEAKRHVHVLFYIFRNDDIGKAIIALLIEKARSGVEVRLIYDSLGTLVAFDTMFKELESAGGQVRPFSPLFSTLSSHLRLNYRNHRKIVVIDGVVGYVGGMNVGVEYMSRDARLCPWRDTHMRITGSAVWFLQERFIMDWGYCSESDPHKVDVEVYFPQPIEEGHIGMQIVSSGPDTVQAPIKSGMLSMMYSAKKYIYIQTPYFAPDESFLDAMRIAARSKVDVRLMIPTISDCEIVHWATLGYAREILDYGVKVCAFRGFLHAKTMVVDDMVTTIGTSNITNRSFTLDFEVNAFVYNGDFSRKYRDIFLEDESNCDAVTKQYFKEKSLIQKAGYNCARLLAPMM